MSTQSQGAQKKKLSPKKQNEHPDSKDIESNLLLNLKEDQRIFITLNDDLPRDMRVGDIDLFPIAIKPIDFYEFKGNNFVRVGFNAPKGVTIRNEKMYTIPEQYDIDHVLEAFEHKEQFDDALEGYEYWANKFVQLKDLDTKLYVEQHKYFANGAQHKNNVRHAAFRLIQNQKSTCSFQKEAANAYKELFRHKLLLQEFEERRLYTQHLVEVMKEELDESTLKMIFAKTSESIKQEVGESKEYETLMTRYKEIKERVNDYQQKSS